MEVKQHVSKQMVGQQMSRRGHEKYLRRIQWKYNILKPINIAKTVLREMFIAIQADLRKQEKFQINNLPYT